MFRFPQHLSFYRLEKGDSGGLSLSKSHHTGIIQPMNQPALITKVSEAEVETCRACIKAVFAGESVVDFLRDVGMSPQTFYDTLKKTSELQDAYADAKRFRAEILANEIVKIADTEDDPQKARNRIQARQWFASKVAPREYGDRMDINVTQTIDIGSALADARARALRPVSDQPLTLDAQVVEYKEENSGQPFDQQSNAPTPAPRIGLTARSNQAAAPGDKPKRGRKPGRKGTPT